MRLTYSRILTKVMKLSRAAMKIQWLSAAYLLNFPRLGGRTIGSTSASGADYPGSSPGLPANLLESVAQAPSSRQILRNLENHVLGFEDLL